MELNSKKILVTGADGFIGSHLTEYLLDLGFDVRALVYYNAMNSWGWLESLSADKKKNLEVVTGDVRDPNAMRKLVSGCDVVFHLAALIGIPYSYNSPDSYVDTNIRGTLNLLQAARDLEVQKFVHTSTSEVYGTAQIVPITEEHPLQAQSPYAATKIAADQLALSFYRSFELPVTIVRPFNTYGPRQSARAVIPSVIIQAASDERVIRLGALTPTRDFNYVTDTVRGFVAVAVSDMAVGETVNIGSNFEIPIGDVAKLILKEMGCEKTITCENERLRPDGSEVERLWADNQKAKRLTGWEPNFSGPDGFRLGIQNTIEWFQESDHLKRYKAEICNL